jgi:Ca-activated chloride channel family protein
MKSITLKLVVLALLEVSAVGIAKTIELTAELDRPVLLADEEQMVYLRVGLRGCPVEILEQRAPVNVAIVIDKSGSMNGGGKIQAAKEAAILALHRLDSRDIVSVILYDSDVEVLVPATRLTDRDRIIRKIRSIDAGGSTALYAGVQAGADQVRKIRLAIKTVDRVVLLSDGLANVGPDSPGALGKLGADLIDEGISVTTIGLGSGYNEDLMSQLAYKSDGGHYFCEEADELAGVFDQEFGRALSVVAQKVIIEIDCPKGMRPVRLLGRQGVIKGQKVTLDMNHIYSEHEKYVLLEVQTDAYANRKSEIRLADVNIRYIDMENNTEEKLNAKITAAMTLSREVYDTRQNKVVYADVVEQIAIENNEKALALRDRGQVQEAKAELISNSAYLRSNAAKLDSDKLDAYAGENESDAEGVEGEDWSVQRKSMRESQSVRKTQR